MRLLTALRWTGSLWFLPFLFAVTCVMGSLRAGGMVSGYPTGDLATMGMSLDLACALTAGFVAAKFNGFVRFARPLRTKRLGSSAVGGAWWALMLGAPTSVCLAILVSARVVPNDLSSWTVIGIQFLTVLTAALTGVAFARGLPVVVAVPAVGGLWFYWLAYGPSSTNRLLHNLDPGLTGCCSGDEQPARNAIAAILVLLVTIMGGILLLSLPRRWASVRRILVAPLTAMTVLLAFGASAGVAVAGVDKLSFTATEPRTTALACRHFDGIDVCLWPENLDQTSKLFGSVQGVNERLLGWDLPLISRLSERPSDRNWTEIDVAPQSSVPELTEEVLSAFINQVAGCRDTYGRWSEERFAFLELAFGAEASDLKYSQLTEVIVEAKTRMAAATADPATVRSWFLADRGHVNCDL